jgi:hypothetical protein
MKIFLLLVTSAMVRAQTAHDPSAVLQEARSRLQAMAESLKQYVCVETVDRSYYRRVPPREAPARPQAESSCDPDAPSTSAGGEEQQLESSDRVRLEVTVSEGRELHSWPGATRFDARDVDELIRDGPVSTGAFSSYLANIFGQPGTMFEYKGEQSTNGRKLFDYAYRVPLQASKFEIKVATAWRPVAFEGDFLLDPESFKLEHLTIRTLELPPDAPFCRAATILDYEPLHAGDSDILLPHQSQLEIALRGGLETRNITTFSNCREYQAESEIVFDTSAATESTATRNFGRGRVALPIGLTVTLALVSPIDTATAAAGDPVAATVVKPVRRPGSAEELIPAGAMVHGRIRRVEHHVSSKPYFVIAMAFNRVEVNGAVSPFVVRSEVDAGLARELGANLAMRETGIRFWGVGTFLFPTTKGHIVIPAGFESKWFTLATGGRSP